MTLWFKLSIAASILLLSTGAKLMLTPPAHAEAKPAIMTVHEDDEPECKDSDGDGECDANPSAQD